MVDNSVQTKRLQHDRNKSSPPRQDARSTDTPVHDEAEQEEEEEEEED